MSKKNEKLPPPPPPPKIRNIKGGVEKDSKLERLRGVVEKKSSK